MRYIPVSAVWEITRKCTMSCKHCGYGSASALPDELTKDEAADLCAALCDLGVQRVCLSGGEPTTRPDWHLIAQRLSRAGVRVGLITNGWTIDEDAIRKAVTAGIDTMMLSIDGVEWTHDHLRQPGSYERALRVLDALMKAPLEYTVVTTVTAANIGELPELLRIFEAKKAPAWKLQLALPLGDTSSPCPLTIEPESINTIISFAQSMRAKTSVEIQLDPCIGCYTNEQPEPGGKDCGENTIEWQGCGAGKSTFGILPNGDIVGCTLIRNRAFIEGSIRKKTLANLWSSPASFLWNRNIKKERLTGFCARCQYGHRCRGGCAAARLAGSGDIFGENRYCSYSQAFSHVAKSIDQTDDIEEILQQSITYIEQEKYQIAELLLWRGLSMDHDNPELLQLYRFVNFMVNPDETDYMNTHVVGEVPYWCTIATEM